MSLTGPTLSSLQTGEEEIANVEQSLVPPATPGEQNVTTFESTPLSTAEDIGQTMASPAQGLASFLSGLFSKGGTSGTSSFGVNAIAVVIGLICIAAGLFLFKPVQNVVVKATRGAATAATVA